jgi:hypothetical protein
MLTRALQVFTHSVHLEVQERACFALEILKLYSTLRASSSNEEVAAELAALFDGTLNPGTFSYLIFSLLIREPSRYVNSPQSLRVRVLGDFECIPRHQIDENPSLFLKNSFLCEICLN